MNIDWQDCFAKRFGVGKVDLKGIRRFYGHSGDVDLNLKEVATERRI